MNMECLSILIGSSYFPGDVEDVIPGKNRSFEVTKMLLKSKLSKLLFVGASAITSLSLSSSICKIKKK